MRDLKLAYLHFVFFPLPRAFHKNKFGFLGEMTRWVHSWLECYIGNNITCKTAWPRCFLGFYSSIMMEGEEGGYHDKKQLYRWITKAVHNLTSNIQQNKNICSPLTLKDKITSVWPLFWLIWNSLLCPSAIFVCKALVHQPCDCTERARRRSLPIGESFDSSVSFLAEEALSFWASSLSELEDFMFGRLCFLVALWVLNDN